MTATATTAAHPQQTTVRARRLTRAAGVAGGTLVNAVIWLIATALGVDFVLTDSTGTGVVDLPTTVIFTVIFGLLGWGSLALLERFTRRGLAIWTVLAVAVVLASMVPIFLVQATTGTQVALVLIHLAVGAALIPAARRYPKYQR